MQMSNPFETSHPTPEDNLFSKVRLIARVDLAFAVLALAVWAYVGAVPATKWGAYAVITTLIGAVTFGSASLIGWVRLSQEEREKDWMALAAGLVSFAVGATMLAFYGASLIFT